MERVYRHRLTTTSGGNLSLRTDEGNGDWIWITPRGTDKAQIRPEQVAYTKLADVDVSAESLQDCWQGSAPPSTEWPLHAAVYNHRKDVHAILHAHSQTLVAFSLAATPSHQIPNTSVLLSAMFELQVGFAQYACPGTPALAKGAAEVASSNQNINCIILQNHGVLCFGKTMTEAYSRFVSLEFLANALLQASILVKIPSAKYRIQTITNLEMESAKKAHLQKYQILNGGSDWPVYSAEKMARAELAAFVKRAYTQGLITASTGSFSCRVKNLPDKEAFVITPTQCDRGTVEAKDFVLFQEGKYYAQAGVLPSRAFHMHAAIYHARPDVNAVIVAQPPSILAYCITNAKFNSHGIPESYIVLGEVPQMPLSFINDAEIGTVFEKGVSCALVSSYGAVCTGPSLLKAFDRLEVLDAMANVQLLAVQRGNVRLLNDEQIKEIERIFFLSLIHISEPTRPY
eukprot:TRINITY_DN8507_c0_g1_i1.p1 TRINITY_DN8507_c0_g1~~TRINITY_DN8507_c0_g1_i1.p1  ORF type:complete len:458 (-),score=58.22 TRINITY_DN8507_c0_g1_i1:2-1375(-)